MLLTSGQAEHGGGKPHWQGRVNPFPEAAVALAYDSSAVQLTIRTEAVAAVDRFVDEYLAVTRPPEGPESSGGSSAPGAHLAGKGRVCVIEGDYGAGKTHLAMELLSRVEAARVGQEEARVDVRVAYQVAPGGNFLSLYAGILKDEVRQDGLVARVKEWYADIVADELQKRPYEDYTRDLVPRIRSTDVDPQDVVDRLGLKEGAIRAEFRRRLSGITPDETFSRALMLLLQEDLRPLAWRWLTGEVPDAVLAEQGITRPIAEVQAMDALGVIARLHGRRDLRFVLVIDELEKLAGRGGTENTARARAFRELITVFREAGALLVVCGLPDIFDILPPRDSGRADTVIQPSPLTPADVGAYVRQAQRSAFAEGTRAAAEDEDEDEALLPFTPDSVRYIAAMTGGLARSVVRICYQAFGWASETGRDIAPALIRQIAHDQVPGGGAERVRVDVGEILAEQGWLSDLRASPVAAADFWIPGDVDGAGCAVYVRDSVLDPIEARGLAGQVAEALAGREDRAVLLVIAGYLHPDQRGTLATAVGDRYLIVHHARDFRRDFARVLGTAMDRVGASRPADRGAGSVLEEVRALRADYERSREQQAVMIRTVQELLSRPGAVREDAETGSGPGPGGREDPLPAELEAIFVRVRQSLDSYGDVRQFLDMTFEVAPRRPGERFPLVHRFRAPDAFSPVGVAAYLSALLDSFRGGVRSWLAESGRGDLRPEAERELLREVCRTYDSLYGVVPVHQLDPLPDRLRLTDSGRGSPARSARRESLEDAFGQLGKRVYQAALEASGAGRSAGDSYDNWRVPDAGQAAMTSEWSRRSF